ncbi:hypothetical protein [Polyangium sp. 15x6]|uniref:hypothetical protein n=1 Tax=Polyangium sp. 15x6 TaxID=3042687 RepID=UPI00249B3DC3|nr:hypothetical protein [Polyangium sp. 15x6]MDI3287496.1 hypothetical protein [Polyangium sp. 15x6]
MRHVFVSLLAGLATACALLVARDAAAISNVTTTLDARGNLEVRFEDNDHVLMTRTYTLKATVSALYVCANLQAEVLPWPEYRVPFRRELEVKRTLTIGEDGRPTEPEPLRIERPDNLIELDCGHEGYSPQLADIRYTWIQVLGPDGFGELGPDRSRRIL